MARKVILKAPVPQSLKDRVDQLAAARDESAALIVREALEYYFALRRDAGSPGMVAEEQAPYMPGQRAPEGAYPAVDAARRVIAEQQARQREAGGAQFAARPPLAPAPTE